MLLIGVSDHLTMLAHGVKAYYLQHLFCCCYRIVCHFGTSHLSNLNIANNNMVAPVNALKAFGRSAFMSHERWIWVYFKRCLSIVFGSFLSFLAWRNRVLVFKYLNWFKIIVFSDTCQNIVVYPVVIISSISRSTK